MGDKREDLRKLSELIKKARGDRSIRQYAIDAGVNPTTVSRMEAMEYKPGLNVLRKLTSEDARPQNGVTFQQLMDAIGYSDGYMNEFKKGASFIGTSAVLAAMLPGLGKALAFGGVAYSLHSRKKSGSQDANAGESFTTGYSIDTVQELEKNHSKLQALSKGLIYDALSEKGIEYRQERNAAPLERMVPDCKIYIDNSEITEWWFQFIEKTPRGIKEDNPTTDEYRAKEYISLFFFLKASSQRMVTIVTDDLEIYREMEKFKDNLALRGNLSILLIDSENIRIEEEVLLSLYSPDSEVISLI